MERIDIGDNSAKFVILPTDTLATIHTAVTSFLSFRGWSLINTVGTVASSQFVAVYSSPTLNGGTKRIKFIYAVMAKEIMLGIAVANESDTTVGLNPEDLKPTGPINSQAHKIKGESTLILYCFASNRWCYVTAGKVDGSIVNVIELTYQDHIVSGLGLGGWLLGPYIPFVLDSTEVVVNNKVVSKHVNDYVGSETLLPSIYAHCDQRYQQRPNVTYKNDRLGTLCNNPSLILHKAGVTGCCELTDSDSTSPFVHVETCSLMSREPETQNKLEYNILNEILCSRSTNGVACIAEPTKGGHFATLNSGDPIEYSDITLGKEALKFNGK
jgi:hypothetical protein